MPALIKRTVVTALKVLALCYPVAMFMLQVPELRYDLGPKAPVVIDGPADLTPGRFPRATFVSVHGTPDFTRAYRSSRHGIMRTYFTLEEFGGRIVVRTYEEVDDDWAQIRQIVGRLRPLGGHISGRTIRRTYGESFGLDVPDDAYLLAIYDTPSLSGWQVAACAFNALLWAVMFYFFFLWRRKKRPAGALI